MASSPLQRYWLFAGDFYYAQGGWHDFRGSYATVAEATAAGQALLALSSACPREWFHVVDSVHGRQVAGTHEQAYGAPAYEVPGLDAGPPGDGALLGDVAAGHGAGGPDAPVEKNAAALALLDAWYATPDAWPPGYGALLHAIATHRLRFREEDMAPPVRKDSAGGPERDTVRGTYY